MRRVDLPSVLEKVQQLFGSHQVLLEGLGLGQHQVALGLGWLHARRILHRDLKAANVFLTSEDDVRLGDLGVARVLSHDTNFAQTFVGTPYYLSPELCEEKPYNEKSDVWAFGCLLYELLTGQAAFRGETVTDVLGAIVHREPDWDALAALPDGIRRVLRGCLRKDARDRLRDMGDVGVMLRDAMAEGPDEPAAAASARCGGALSPGSSGHSRLDEQRSVWGRRSHWGTHGLGYRSSPGPLG